MPNVMMVRQFTVWFTQTHRLLIGLGLLHIQLACCTPSRCILYGHFALAVRYWTACGWPALTGERRPGGVWMAAVLVFAPCWRCSTTRIITLFPVLISTLMLSLFELQA